MLNDSIFLINWNFDPKYTIVYFKYGVFEEIGEMKNLHIL